MPLAPSAFIRVHPRLTRSYGALPARILGGGTGGRPAPRPTLRAPPTREALMRGARCARSVALGSLILGMTPPDPAAAQAAPPAAPRRPHVDTLHGEVRQDDWFWLKQK